jgi:hypothetical protein
MDVLTVSMGASMLPHPPERVRHGGGCPPWCGLPVDANPAGGQPLHSMAPFQMVQMLSLQGACNH